MGERTEIAWTHATWNPWVGCHKVSEACAHCYMFRDMARYGNDADRVRRTAPATFNSPLKWAKHPAKRDHIKYVFTCSWSDFFIEEADAWRNDAWAIIRKTPFIYQILTKRPERIAACLPDDWGSGYANVWLGITAENQRNYEKRVDALCRVRATRRFVSVEPMLGPINLGLIGTAPRDWGVTYCAVCDLLNWVICGCESGPQARETNLGWVRKLRDECEGSDTAFFLKQLMVGGKLTTTPELDGRQWVQFPAE